MTHGRVWENIAIRMLRHKVYGAWVNRAIQQLFQRYYYAYVAEGCYLPAIWPSLLEWLGSTNAQRILVRARPRKAFTLWRQSGVSLPVGVLLRFKPRITHRMASYLAEDGRYSFGDLNLGSGQFHLLLYLGELTQQNIESLAYCRVGSNKTRLRWTPMQPLQECSW